MVFSKYLVKCKKKLTAIILSDILYQVPQEIGHLSNKSAIIKKCQKKVKNMLTRYD